MEIVQFIKTVNNIQEQEEQISSQVVDTKSCLSLKHRMNNMFLNQYYELY